MTAVRTLRSLGLFGQDRMSLRLADNPQVPCLFVQEVIFLNVCQMTRTKFGRKKQSAWGIGCWSDGAKATLWFLDRILEEGELQRPIQGDFSEHCDFAVARGSFQIDVVNITPKQTFTNRGANLTPKYDNYSRLLKVLANSVQVTRLSNTVFPAPTVRTILIISPMDTVSHTSYRRDY